MTAVPCATSVPPDLVIVTVFPETATPSVPSIFCAVTLVADIAKKAAGNSITTLPSAGMAVPVVKVATDDDVAPARRGDERERGKWVREEVRRVSEIGI